MASPALLTDTLHHFTTGSQLFNNSYDDIHTAHKEKNLFVWNIVVVKTVLFDFERVITSLIGIMSK